MEILLGNVSVNRFINNIFMEFLSSFRKIPKPMSRFKAEVQFIPVITQCFLFFSHFLHNYLFYYSECIRWWDTVCVHGEDELNETAFKTKNWWKSAPRDGAWIQLKEKKNICSHILWSFGWGWCTKPISKTFFQIKNNFKLLIRKQVYKNSMKTRIKYYQWTYAVAALQTNQNNIHFRKTKMNEYLRMRERKRNERNNRKKIYIKTPNCQSTYNKHTKWRLREKKK